MNRVWADYSARGIIDPPDDLNLANPPSNAALLDYLADGFIDSRLRHEVAAPRDRRTAAPISFPGGRRPPIARTSGTTATPSIRRLPAEVVVDAIQQATARIERAGANRQPTSKAGASACKRPAFLRRTDYSLAVFGKPLRMINCDCEREADPSLLQSVYLRNDPDVAKIIDRPGGWLKEIKADAEIDQLVEEAYLRSLCRLPSEAEVARCRQYLAESQALAEGLRDLLWSLLNTQEFITNH